MSLALELALQLDPSQILRRSGITPDDWQQQIIRERDQRVMLNCSRQSGKSTVVAGMALDSANVEPEKPVLILTPSQRQSSELLRTVMQMHGSTEMPIEDDSSMRVEFKSGARIIALPGKRPENIRGIANVALLIIDEAAWVPDVLYRSVRPMLAVSHGRIVLLSTPFYKRGFFYDEWHSGTGWKRIRVTADQCPRISPDFLAEEKRKLPRAWFLQEYFGVFAEAEDAVFLASDIQAALSDEVLPMFGAGVLPMPAGSATITDDVKALFG